MALINEQATEDPDAGVTLFEHLFSSFAEEQQKEVLGHILEQYTIGTQEARELLDMTSSQLSYHLDNETLSATYTFNTHTNYHRYRIFLRSEVERYAKNFRQYIHLYRKNRRNHY